MATHGDGFTENGKEYTWDIAGYGTEGNWQTGSVPENVLADHIADSDWGFTVHWEIDGVDHYAFVHGGYDIDDLDDIVQDFVDDDNY